MCLSKQAVAVATVKSVTGVPLLARAKFKPMLSKVSQPAVFVNHGGGPQPLMGQQPSVSKVLRKYAATLETKPAATSYPEYPPRDPARHRRNISLAYGVSDGESCR